MLNGKFIATRGDTKIGSWFTKGSAYTFVDGVMIFDNKLKSDRYNSIDQFEYCNPSWKGILTHIKQFTKSDLKEGNIVEYECGDKRLVLTKSQTLHHPLLGMVMHYLKHYNEDLTSKGSKFEDIVKVYDTEDTLLWEREIPKSPEQIEIERLELEIANMSEKLAVLKGKVEVKVDRNQYKVGTILRVIDGGYGYNIPSTIVDLSGYEPVVIREGKGSLDIL
jgi:hypothetical protein